MILEYPINIYLYICIVIKKHIQLQFLVFVEICFGFEVLRYSIQIYSMIFLLISIQLKEKKLVSKNK